MYKINKIIDLHLTFWKSFMVLEGAHPCVTHLLDFCLYEKLKTQHIYPTYYLIL